MRARWSRRWQPLAPHAFLVLPLPFGLSTADVYREADRLGLPRSHSDLEAGARRLRAALEAPLPPALRVNDLQPAALSLRPAIERALDDALYAGSEHAMVSGSGPTVLGLFWGEDAAARASAGVAALSRSLPWGDHGRAGRRLVRIPAPGLTSSPGSGTIRSWPMTNEAITYLVGACLGVFGLCAFLALVVIPAMSAYRRVLERAAVAILSLYVLAALVGVGVLLGGLIVVEWPRVF